MSYGMSSPMGGQRKPAGSAASRFGKQFKEDIPSGYRKGAIQQFTPEQMDLFQQLFGHLGPDSFLSRLAGGEEGIFDEMEAPAMKQFHELQGQLGSRFSGMGMGAQRGSGFKNTANQAASDFAMQLQGQRQGLQSQALGDLMGLSKVLLSQRPVDRFVAQKRQKQSSGLGGIIGGALGGLAGGLPGASMGHKIGSAF